MPGSRDPLEVLLALTRLLGDERTLEDALQATTDAALEVLPLRPRLAAPLRRRAARAPQHRALGRRHGRAAGAVPRR
ncbi:MAG: hypothetical protein M5U28_00910 [Sandaracinaceae bacterium]|nr:hypothetical protein [Sandaracinaceae bacterium]